MSQNIYNFASAAAIFSMAASLFSLKKEYELFRKDVIKIMTGLGILVKNDSQGMTIHIEERRKDNGSVTHH